MERDRQPPIDALVTWLRAPAAAPGAVAPLLRPATDTSFLARLTLAPLLFVVLAAVACVLVKTTEIYIVRDGIGDDGAIYAAVLRAFDGHLDHIQDLGLNSYTAQRCLSPFLVRYAMNLFRMSTDSPSIIAAYKVANAISIMIAIACMLGSARHLRLSRAGLLVTAVLFTLNFSTLYWLPFDPVITDGMAFAIGSLQLWSYLSRRYVVLAFVSALGGFIWPSAMQVGVVMLFFARMPRTADVAEPALFVAGETRPGDGPQPIDTAIAAVLAAVVTWYASTLADYVPPYGQLPATKIFFRLSCAILCFMTFIALKELIRVGPSVRQLLRYDRDAILAKVLGVVTFIGVSKALAWIAIAPTARIPQASTFTAADVLKGAVFFAVQRPLVTVFAHVGFFGPAILLMFWCWRNVANDARRLGFGINAALGMTFFMLFNSQSRGAIELIPIALPLAVTAAARLPWTPRRLLELGAAALIASKLWYSIVQKPKFDFASLMDNVGPWMSNDSYAAHGVLAAGISVWILWMSKQRPADGERVWLSEEQPPGPAA